MGKYHLNQNDNGNITSSTHIANLNPIRYRGYYYDSETGFYYLNSRYYDPEVGRFINADDSQVLTLDPTSFYDKNLYAYCDNNPVSRSDESGYIWWVAGTLNVTVSLFSSLVTGEEISVWGLVVDFTLGALSTFDMPCRVLSAVGTGIIEVTKTYEETNSLTKAISQGIFYSTLSYFTIGNKLGKYFDDTDKLAKCFVSSVFDIGQSLVIFGVDQINQSFKKK